MDIFSGTQPTLEEILQSREDRSAKQSFLLSLTQSQSLACMTVNMPGKVKLNLASQTFFSQGLTLFRALFNEQIVYEEVKAQMVTGPVYYACLDLDAKTAKKRAVSLEEKMPWCRMLDIDIISNDGTDDARKPISRADIGKSDRKCLVCSESAKNCASRQSHTEEEIKKAIEKLYFNALSSLIGSTAKESLIQEALCTPKPGLVDRSNNGSHSDMNLQMLVTSATALEPHFAKMAQAGFENLPFEELRKLGKDAETAMLFKTKGVNTHRGAIFCLGLFCYAAGQALSEDAPLEVNDLCAKVSKLCEGMENELKDSESKGAKAYQAYGILGARGQAIDGYRSITENALPMLSKCISDGMDLNDSLCRTLLCLIANVDDTNIVSRSDLNTLRQIQTRVKLMLQKQVSNEEIEKLDEDFISMNLSPGGCADLLAATLFLYSITG